jgi:hypothetical protein
VTDMRRAYSSTVVAPGQIVVGVVLAAAFWAVTAFLSGSGWITGAAVALVIVLAGIHLATVRLMVSPERVRIGQGPWRCSGRSIMTDAVLDARAERLGLAQTFGVGVPFHWRTTRLTVRPGPALVLVLADGEHIRASTPDPAAAVQLILGDRRMAGADVPRSPGESPGKRPGRAERRDDRD